MTPGDDLDRLERKLARLAATPTALGPRGRPLGVAPDLLAALLTEVDETMQARQLRFVTNSGRELVCRAYGRRLLACPDLGWEGEPPDDARLAALREGFERWLSGATVLSVQVEPLDRAPDPARFGIAAETLAAAWGLRLEPAQKALPGPLDALLARFDGTAVAWLRVRQDAVHAWGGDRGEVALLTRLAAEALPGLRRAADAAAGGRHCTILGSDGSGAAVALALEGGDALVLRLALEDLDEVGRIWREATDNRA